MNLRRVLPFVLVALPLPAFASSARVAARIADLRAEPSSDAKSKAKLPSGRDLEVIGKSDDGKWVRVRAECPKANETIHFEGWLAVRDVQGANLEGLAVAGSAKSSAAKSDAKSDWSDDSSSKPASSDAAWGDDSAASAKTDTASAKDEWGNDAAPAAAESKPAASDAAWGDDNKPAPAASSSDSAKGDEWGSSSDSSSSSKSGGDEWSSGGSDSGSTDSSSTGDGW